MRVQDNMLKVIEKLGLNYIKIDSNQSIEVIYEKIRSYLNDTSS